MKDIEGIDRALEVLRPHWSEVEADFERHNARFLAMAAANPEPIGRVLPAHLIIENFLNSFLPAHYGFDIEGLRLSFFQKASLLPRGGSAAAFVRPGILQINSVRNKFAHEVDHEVARHEISAVFEALTLARLDLQLPPPMDAIEAFTPVACAFLSVPPKHLQGVFMEAFEGISVSEDVEGE